MSEVIVIQPKQSPENQILRVAAYCRVSSDSDDQLHSFFAQVGYYTKLINENKKMELVDIYADEGISGTQKCKRDDFLRLISDCRKGKIDRIITKSVSRFARNTLESLETAREFKALGVSIYFEEDNLDTNTMSSEAILTLKSSVAQAGSLSISKNMRLGIRMKMKNGTFITNMVPFGYDYIDQKMIVNKQKAAIVRRIYDEYLKGYGITTIALRFNNEGILHGENAVMWHSSHIHQILTNPKYIGDMIMQRTYRTEDIPYTKKINHGEVQWYYKHQTHEAIIDRDTFTAVQEIMECKAKPHCNKTPIAEKPPLWQKIKCGECGHTYRKKISSGKMYWTCYYHNINSRYCQAKPIAESIIYKAFCDMYNKLKINSDKILAPAISQLTALKQQKRLGNTRIGELDRQIAELGEQNLVIARLKSKGYMDENDYIEQKNNIDGQIKKLRDERIRQLKASDGDDTLEQLITLQAIIDGGPPYMADFDSQIFVNITREITAADTALIFKLQGGLEFTENIGKEQQDET